MFKDLLSKKSANWEESKKEASERMTELGKFFCFYFN